MRASCLASFSDFMGKMNLKAQALDWQMSGALLPAMAVALGLKARWTGARRFILLCRNRFQRVRSVGYFQLIMLNHQILPNHSQEPTAAAAAVAIPTGS